MKADRHPAREAVRSFLLLYSARSCCFIPLGLASSAGT